MPLHGCSRDRRSRACPKCDDGAARTRRARRDGSSRVRCRLHRRRAARSSPGPTRQGRSSRREYRRRLRSALSHAGTTRRRIDRVGSSGPAGHRRRVRA
ncbi:MAG: hypothetical protein EA382_14950 [Spirochaetaceae bacterium]|nr:MAG: hypothetical protein EA382_14950 [Spirochaetaceae bacterium]